MPQSVVYLRVRLRKAGKKRIEHKIKISKREISPTNSCFLGVVSKSPARGSRESWVRDIAPHLYEFAESETNGIVYIYSTIYLKMVLIKIEKFTFFERRFGSAHK